jgi:hypothetical protein
MNSANPRDVIACASWEKEAHPLVAMTVPQRTTCARPRHRAGSAGTEARDERGWQRVSRPTVGWGHTPDVLGPCCGHWTPLARRPRFTVT